jgi:pyridoxal biosynthesis lyase PdxS
MSDATGGKNGNGSGRQGAESFELKVGLAEMMKNGVIMDVTARA